MIKQEIFNYTKGELIHWLRHEAGSSNADYFHAVKMGGLKLQQVPEEFAGLLLFVANRNIKNYLELGIGNGGSFAVMSFFMQSTLQSAMAVDNLAYRNLIGQNEGEIKAYINSIPVDADFYFVNSTTDNYFYQCDDDLKYDCIFIDADHSYQGARKDYDNALKHINKGGIIIFHDINSDACPGIKKLWSEVKNETAHEFIASKTCGIGVIEIN